jgi:glycosyltransferase involved in cell wall biosynthesis
MKILFTSLFLPHPLAHHATAFTVYKALKYLSRRHEVSLIAFVDSEKELEYSRYIGDYCRRLETVLLPQNGLRKLKVRAQVLTLRPITFAQGYCYEMRNRIRSVLREDRFDIVQVEYAPMGQYISEFKDLPALINIHDVISVMAKNFVKNLHFSRTKLEWLIDSLLCPSYESRLYAKFDRVLTLSSKMKEILLARNPLLDVSVVPAGVDIPKIRKAHGPGKGGNLIFVGAMWRHENIDAVMYFYRSVFGRIRREVPGVKLHIVGGSPVDEVRRLATDPDVRVTGYVQDLSSYYLNCDVSIAPMRMGGGLQCKVLDAMAAGLPVIASSAANAGICARSEEEIFVADAPEEFARRTVELLQDGQKRKTISQNGLEFVRNNFGWDQVIEKLETIYQDCLSTHN